MGKLPKMPGSEHMQELREAMNLVLRQNAGRAGACLDVVSMQPVTFTFRAPGRTFWLADQVFTPLRTASTVEGELYSS